MSLASTQPFHFGPANRRLFGIFYPASDPADERPAIVLAQAFGQEAIRAQRLMRVLAERLVRKGHSVLRFDYYGTGDSMGDDLDGDLEGWSADLLTADEELRLRSGDRRTVWIGMRLGGTVALRAAEAAPRSLVRLLLWDPPLDGAAYLGHLRARHVANLDEAYSLPAIPPYAEQADSAARFSDEALGFALSTTLREQIAALKVETRRWPARPESIVIVTDPEDVNGLELRAACVSQPGRVRAVALSHGTDWTSDAGDNTALVPPAALAQLVEEAGAPW